MYSIFPKEIFTKVKIWNETQKILKGEVDVRPLFQSSDWKQLGFSKSIGEKNPRDPRRKVVTCRRWPANLAVGGKRDFQKLMDR